MTDSSQIDRVLKTEIDPAFALRARLIANVIMQEKPKKILDAGCGRGFYVRLMSLLDFPHEIVGVDIQEKYLKKAKDNTRHDKRITIKKASLYELPFPDNSFDAIICSEVLEHLKDDAKAVTELHRVLKKGGTIIVTVPNTNFPFLWDPLNWLLMKLFGRHIDKNIWWLAGIWADHERLYTQEEITQLLKKKFKVSRVEPVLAWCWPFSHFLLYGVGKNIVERLGASEFDRFSNAKQTGLSHFFARVMKLPERLTAWLRHNSSVNIFIVSQKQ